MKYRFAQHDLLARTGRESYLYNAMRKHGDRILVKTLLEADEDYCLNMEYKLRPTPKTGWNAGIGGQNTMLGYKHSDQTKQRMSDASPTKGGNLCPNYVRARAESRKSLGLKHSDAGKAKLSAARLALNIPPWENPAANPLKWAQAEEVSSYLASGLRHCDILKIYSLPRKDCSLSKVVSKIKAGWNPTTDEAYQLWLQQYRQKECNESTQTI